MKVDRSGRIDCLGLFLSPLAAFGHSSSRSLIQPIDQRADEATDNMQLGQSSSDHT
jgi:hypothetical protein